MVNRPGNNYEPGEEMILAQTGNFTDLDRQTYILFDTLNGNNCITFFDNANTWDPEPAQMKSWLGKKKGMKVQGFDCDNYSAVLQNILMTGLIFQTDTITGQPIRVPLDKGAWEAGPHAYFDRVSHNGSLWLCINPEGTESEPADNNPDWLKQVAEGQRGLQGLQGEKGEQGIPGPKGETGATGAAGKTSYFHIKYSNDGGKTFTGNNGEDVGDWMGTYVDFTQSDSGSVSAYKWMKTKGAQGAKVTRVFREQTGRMARHLICTSLMPTLQMVLRASVPAIQPINSISANIQILHRQIVTITRSIPGVESRVTRETRVIKEIRDLRAPKGIKVIRGLPALKAFPVHHHISM